MKRTTMKSRDLFFDILVLVADIVIPNFIQAGFLTHSSNPEPIQNQETGESILVIEQVNGFLANWALHGLIWFLEE